MQDTRRETQDVKPAPVNIGDASVKRFNIDNPEVLVPRIGRLSFFNL
ncbi:hypothetical protein ACFSKL_18400 [Belliella marina]|uniref:Uncharacterized protein n=1 Tax=Belliella marina TaxID=1644146 RepID=A0ABW4VPR5_9BACT